MSDKETPYPLCKTEEESDQVIDDIIIGGVFVRIVIIAVVIAAIVLFSVHALSIGIPPGVVVALAIGAMALLYYNIRMTRK